MENSSPILIESCLILRDNTRSCLFNRCLDSPSGIARFPRNERKTEQTHFRDIRRSLRFFKMTADFFSRRFWSGRVSQSPLRFTYLEPEYSRTISCNCDFANSSIFPHKKKKLHKLKKKNIFDPTSCAVKFQR